MGLGCGVIFEGQVSKYGNCMVEVSKMDLGLWRENGKDSWQSVSVHGEGNTFLNRTIIESKKVKTENRKLESKGVVPGGSISSLVMLKYVRIADNFLVGWSTGQTTGLPSSMNIDLRLVAVGVFHCWAHLSIAQRSS